jgi:hypothetical protein
MFSNYIAMIVLFISNLLNPFIIKKVIYLNKDFFIKIFSICIIGTS